MRSLAVKLALAFLLVSLTGVVLFAVLFSLRGRSEFDRFLSSRDQQVLIDALKDYYDSNGKWDDVRQNLLNRQPLLNYSRNAILVDARQRIVYSNHPRFAEGSVAPQTLILNSLKLENENSPATVIGYLDLTIDSPPGRGLGQGGSPQRGPPPESDFFNRVGWAAVASVAISIIISFLLGSVLARTLTKPIRALTTATALMATGKLGQQVTVHSKDEIGNLAMSFNHMSRDLAKASQARKQMTADLAHDLRTPLSILKGYAEGLIDGRVKGNGAIYDVMHGEIVHMQRLVEDLRVLSLADAGELPINRRAISPNLLLERTVLAYFMQAEQMGIALKISADDALPQIYVDPDRMTQVLNNLVSNAFKYTKHGEIVLSAQANNDNIVTLSVSDSGEGIAPDHLPFIFDRFYRTDSARVREDLTTNSHAVSSGLGLAIAKAIVEAHGGKINVESELGKGTTFRITLSRQAQPPAS
jgi:two-component system sensor histidine kinase BaeS